MDEKINKVNRQINSLSNTNKILKEEYEKCYCMLLKIEIPTINPLYYFIFYFFGGFP